MANVFGHLFACLRSASLGHRACLLVSFVLLFTIPGILLSGNDIRTRQSIVIGLGSKNAPLLLTWSPQQEVVIRRDGQSQHIHSFRNGKPVDTHPDFASDRNEDGRYLLLMKEVTLEHAGAYDYEFTEGGHYSELNVTVVGELLCKKSDGSSFCSATVAGSAPFVINLIGQNSQQACGVKFYPIDGVRGKAVCKVPEYQEFIGCELNFGDEGSYRKHCSFQEGGDEIADIIARLDRQATLLKWIVGILVPLVTTLALYMGTTCLFPSFPQHVNRFICRWRTEDATDSEMAPLRQRATAPGQQLPVSTPPVKDVNPVQAEDTHDDSQGNQGGSNDGTVDEPPPF